MFNFLRKKIKEQNFIDKEKIKSNKDMLAEYQTVFNGKSKVSNPASAPEAKKEANAIQDHVMNDPVAELRQWKAPKILKTNLIQDEAFTFFDVNKNAQLFIISALSASLIIAILYGSLYLWESQALTRQATLNEEISSVNSDIIKLSKELTTAEDLEKKINMAGTLLSKHIYWSNFFKFIEDNTLKNVSYTNGLTGNNSGLYRFNAVTDSFASVAEQARLFKENKDVRSVDITAAGIGNKEANVDKQGGGSNISFDIEIQIDPQIFYDQTNR